MSFGHEMPYGLVHSCKRFGGTSIFLVEALKTEVSGFSFYPHLNIRTPYLGAQYSYALWQDVMLRENQCSPLVMPAPVFIETDCASLYLLTCLSVPASSKVKPTKFLSPMCLSFSNFLFATMLLGQCTESAPMAYPVCNWTYSSIRLPELGRYLPELPLVSTIFNTSGSNRGVSFNIWCIYHSTVPLLERRRCFIYSEVIRKNWN